MAPKRPPPPLQLDEAFIDFLITNLHEVVDDIGRVSVADHFTCLRTYIGQSRSELVAADASSQQISAKALLTFVRTSLTRRCLARHLPPSTVFLPVAWKNADGVTQKGIAYHFLLALRDADAPPAAPPSTPPTAVHNRLMHAHGVLASLAATAGPLAEICGSDA